MCGIFGYIGAKEEAADMVLVGLKLLEYRGYDSWGITVKTGKKLAVEKHIGKIGVAAVKMPASTLGIGHTRWATHGGVSVENAHPHLDCAREIAVVHNGIVENFSEIKKELVAYGHTFLSDTDTEVIPHLIEEFLKKEPARLASSPSSQAGRGGLGESVAGRGFATSVRDAFNMLKGMNAIVVANSAAREIVACKNGSPLVVGIGKNEYWIASDASGIVKHTKKVIFLKDNEMVILGKNLQLLSLPKGGKTKLSIITLDWQFENAEKGKYPHYFLKEIFDQPQVIKTIALGHTDKVKKLVKDIEKAYGTFMLACGSAAHAALAGTYLFSSIGKKHINFAIGSEFNYLQDYITPKTLVVPISQSGESVDVISPVSEAKKRGAKIAAIVNVQGSTLYRMADENVLLQAGIEKCVIATKSFVAMLSIVLLTAFTLAGKQKKARDMLLRCAEDVEKLLKKKTISDVKKTANMLKTKEHIFVIGRGLAYITALEAALKLKESAYVHAEGFAGGELKHGSLALIEKGTPCIVIAPNDRTYDEIISNAQEIKARGGTIIGIGPVNNQVFDVFLETADLEEATMISQVVIVQLLAYYLALERGVPDPDKPRNLAKSVTVK